MPVWLIGTSMGTVSAANGAARLTAGGPDGLVLTSTVTRQGRERIETVGDVRLDAIRVPTLVVHHKNDACRATPYADTPASAARPQAGAPEGAAGVRRRRSPDLGPVRGARGARLSRAGRRGGHRHRRPGSRPRPARNRNVVRPVLYSRHRVPIRPRRTFMSWFTLRSLRLAVARRGRHPRGARRGLGQDRDLLVARAAGHPRRARERDRHQVQRLAERLRGEGDLQGLVPGDAQRGHRRLPGQAGAARRAGLRGRHADHAVLRRGLSGLPADEGQQHRHRLERSHRSGQDVLLERRQPLLDGVQLVDADPLLQQGPLQEGRAARQGAGHVGRGRGDGQEAGGLRRQVRLQHRVAVVGHHGEHARLPRPAVRRSRQRLRRPGHQSEDQRRLRREDARAPAARRQGRLVHLQRPAEQGRGQHGRRRVRDLHDVVGLHRQHHQDGRGQVRVGARRRCRAWPGSRTATPSSAAPRCG